MAKVNLTQSELNHMNLLILQIANAGIALSNAQRAEPSFAFSKSNNLFTAEQNFGAAGKMLLEFCQELKGQKNG